MMTDKKLKGAKTAFDASIDCGITFIDTAEVYGSRVGNVLMLAILFNLLSCTKKVDNHKKTTICSTCSSHSVR